MKIIAEEYSLQKIVNVKKKILRLKKMSKQTEA